MIGILPTLRREHLTAETPVGQPAVRAAQRADLRRPRRGPAHRASTACERLAITADTIAPEAACTSVQFHLQVSPAAVRRLLERRPGRSPASRWRSARTRRFFFGQELWRETRIPLFEQATDTRPEELKAQGVRPRVWFGERWITSVFDLFEENVRYFPALLPLCDAGGPGRGPRARRRAPSSAELTPAQRHRLPVEPAGLRGGHGPARTCGWRTGCCRPGPTVVDIIANGAFYYGLVRVLAEADRPVWTRMSFSAAEENFHTCARHGIDAQVYWPGLG